MPAASGHAREKCNRSTRLPRLLRLLMPAPPGLIRMQPVPTTSATTASALAAAATRAAAPPMRPVGPLVVTCCARRAQGSWRPCIRHLQANNQQVVVDVLPCRLALALALPLAFGITMRRLFHEACGTTMQRCLGGPLGVWVKNEYPALALSMAFLMVSKRCVARLGALAGSIKSWARDS